MVSVALRAQREAALKALLAERRARPLRPLAERFAAKVGPTTERGCVLWTGATGTFGYGQIGRGRRGDGQVQAHRVAWELAHGPIPDGLCVLHRCDNPPCVNVEHLFLGTKADNVSDMCVKGRHVPAGTPGETHHAAKLTDADVREARRLRSQGVTWKALGKRFGLTTGGMAASILRGWRHV